MGGGDDNDINDDKKKTHRARLAGRKAEKKKKKNAKFEVGNEQHKNSKAFAINNVVRAERKFRRAQEIKGKKEHFVVVDRTPLEPPPILVAIVGPPKVGKTTLLRCLIKSYCRQPLSSIRGPVTVVSGKKRRITFIECNNDINSFVDIAKVADLVLLLIDASFGFEMEIFEFLNICQVHGMPRIMGVLTHLDMIKRIKKMRKIKKTLKRRFWTEVYAGAKLFYLSGMNNEEYLRNEVKNLARFISVMKFRPLTWQTTHSYILADRMEDVTPPEEIRQNPLVDRNVCIYGYMRGIPMNMNSFIHIPGCGDFPVSDSCFLPDPCPLPGVAKKRCLLDKERMIYAPFSGVGGIVYDKDAVYVDLPSAPDKPDSNSIKEIVHTLIDTKETIDEKLAKSTLRLFSNSEPIVSEEFGKDAESCIVERNGRKIELVNDGGRKRKKVIFEDDQEDTEGENGNSEEEVEGWEDEDEDEEDIDEDDNDKMGSISGAEVKRRKFNDGRLDDVIESDEVDLTDCVGPTEQEDEQAGKSYDPYTSDESDDDAEKTKGNKAALVAANEKEIAARFRAVQSDQDREIMKRISAALGAVGGKNTKSKANDVKQNSGIKNRAKTHNEGSESSSDEGGEEPGNIAIGPVPWQNQSYSSDEDAINDGEGDDADDDADSGQGEEFSEQEDEEESDDDLPQDTDHKWKENLAAKAAHAYLDHQSSSVNLWKLVYGEDSNTVKKEEERDEEEIGGLFRVVAKKQHAILKDKESMDAFDCSKFRTANVGDWTLPECQERIKDCFVTGKWASREDAEELIKLDDLSEDEELFGDFEDLEKGTKVKSQNTPAPKGSDEVSDEESKSTQQLSKEQLMEKKRKLKEKFDLEYDNGEEQTYFEELKSEANKQAELNRNRFDGMDDALRVEMEGLRAGMYVRLEIRGAPCELVTNFDPVYPLIAGGLQPAEHNIGYLKMRIKKHRWYGRILKSGDPVVISMGWRRFQTVAIFSKQEDNMRHRMIKYTPEHVSCMAHVWGPATRSGTGYLILTPQIVQSSDQMELGFRIAATGTALDNNQSTVVTKKLKLIGEPMKIFKKTAFIKGMFNSCLEVAKFEGAKIKTVSGIRGQIKKAVNKPPGCFRATFEDKILLSDLVFCRTWYKVTVPQFYAAVTSLLLPPGEKNAWRGMKTVGQLKRERGIRNPAEPDSLYTAVERKEVKRPPLVVPRAVEAALPYSYKMKLPTLKTESLKHGKGKKGLPFSKKLSKIVIRDEYETKVASFMDKLRMSFTDKEDKRKKLKSVKFKQFINKKKAETLHSLRKQKEIKKRIFKTLSQTKPKGPI